MFCLLSLFIYISIQRNKQINTQYSFIYDYVITEWVATSLVVRAAVAAFQVAVVTVVLTLHNVLL